MTRASAVALALTAVLAVTACADNILKERPVNSAKHVATAAPKFAVTTKGQSSVCAAYRRQLSQVKSQQSFAAIAHRSTDALKARELSLNAVIADACE
jgi:hypothetical protein